MIPPRMPGLAQTLFQELKESPDLLQPRITWPIYDAAQVEHWPEDLLEWMLSPLIARGSIGLWGGLPRRGKTLLLMDALLHVLHRKKWLDRFTGTWVPRMVYLAADDRRGRLQERLLELEAGYGFPHLEPGNLMVLDRPGFQLTEPADVEALGAWCMDQGVGFLVIDVLGRVIRGKDQFNPRDWSEIQGALELLNRTYQLTLELVDHARKPPEPAGKKKTREPSALDIKGVIEKWGMMDNTLVLGRTEDGLVEILSESKDTDEFVHLHVQVSAKHERHAGVWMVKGPDGLWVPSTPGPKLSFVRDVVKVKLDQIELGKVHLDNVWAACSDRFQIGELDGMVKKTDGKNMGRDTILKHLTTLVQQGKLGTGGKGKQTWYWKQP